MDQNAPDPLDAELESAVEAGVKVGHAAMLRGVADMMRTLAKDPMFPLPKFSTDTSAAGITRAWADLLDVSADAIENEATA